MSEYKKRIADILLKEKLEGKGAVLIEGPKWCGKTTTAMQVAKSVLLISDPQKIKTYKILAETEPNKLLEGETPRLIDEWQITPTLWDAIRFEVDQRHTFGQFILTGSSIPGDLNEVQHTGTGRFSRLRMRPMSLYESLDSTGEVSLSKLFIGDDSFYAESKLTLEDICYLICRGGWPMATYLDGKIALNQAIDYYDDIVNSDISRIDNVKKDVEKVKKLMASLARNQGCQVGEETLAKDVYANDNDKISSVTIHNYLNALRKLFVIEDIKAWNPNLRSKTAIRIADTRYFIDPSIAAASLGIGPGDLLNDLNTLGFLFETLVMRDLNIYSEALDGQVYHYRDKNNLECDAVIHLRNGSYGLIEIKIGGEQLIEAGASSLLKLASKIDDSKMKKPSFLMVIVATGTIAYKRKDNVLVVPIGTLGI